MRCPHCGGIMHHFLIADGGHNFYLCHTGLTSFEKDGSRNSYITSCNTVQDETGRFIKPGKNLAYMSEGKAHSYMVGQL